MYFSATYTFRPPHQRVHTVFEALFFHHYTLKMDTREVAIQNAIRDLNSGVFTSVRKAAAAYGIPRSSLTRPGGWSTSTRDSSSTPATIDSGARRQL